MCILNAQVRTKSAPRGCQDLGLGYCKLSRVRFLLRCPCAFRQRRLAQSVGPGLPRAHFSWQAQYFVDLDETVAETSNLLVILADALRSW